MTRSTDHQVPANHYCVADALACGDPSQPTTERGWRKKLKAERWFETGLGVRAGKAWYFPIRLFPAATQVLLQQPAAVVARMLNQWVRDQGLALVSVFFSGDTPLADVLASAAYGSFGLHYLLSGTSRTGVDHVVICQGAEIVWDPSRVDSGIIGPLASGTWLVEWLVRPPVSSEASPC